MSLHDLFLTAIFVETGDPYRTLGPQIALRHPEFASNLAFFYLHCAGQGLLQLAFPRQDPAVRRPGRRRTERHLHRAAPPRQGRLAQRVSSLQPLQQCLGRAARRVQLLGAGLQDHDAGQQGL